MLSRHFCLEGRVEGQGAASYRSINERWDDIFTCVVRDGKLAIGIGETVVRCDAYVVPGKVLKLSSCTGNYLTGRCFPELRRYQLVVGGLMSPLA
jgi:hypothetical protein